MTTNWIRANEVVWEELNGETLLVSPAAGTRWLLNGMAARIWKLCDGSRCVDELAEIVAQPGEEIVRFCRQFRRMGLLSESRGTSGSPALCSGAVCLQSGLNSAPSFKLLGLASGPRRRPSPRGNSGPG